MKPVLFRCPVCGKVYKNRRFCTGYTGHYHEQTRCDVYEKTNTPHPY